MYSAVYAHANMSDQEIRFISRVVNMGEDRFILNIPKEVHDRVEKIKGQQVVVSVSKAID